MKEACPRLPAAAGHPLQGWSLMLKPNGLGSPAFCLLFLQSLWEGTAEGPFLETNAQLYQEQLPWSPLSLWKRHPPQ